MSITKVPAVGLQIDMEEYIRLRLSSNGPDFWYPSHQDVLCKMLAPFLPRMTYDAMTNKVTASIVENGKELLSQSEDCSTIPIPAKQLEMFSNLLKGLKSKIESEVVDPDTKSLIKGFKLPDPDKAPEMYRIYGDKRHPRLAILWGMEKVVDSSISVVDMNVAETLKPHAAKSSGKGKWVALLLALAAAGLVWYAFSGDDEEHSSTDPSSAGNGGSSAPGAPTPGAPTPGTPAPGAPAPGAPAPGAPAPGTPAPGNPVPGTESTPSAGLVQPGDTVIPNARDIDEIIAPAVWQVLVVKGKEIRSTATAFCFDPAGRFITNHHVAKDFNEKGVKYILKNDSSEIEVTACPYMDEARDLAVLKVETPKEALPYLRLQKDIKPVRGEAIYVEGYPEGIAKIISQGIVSAVVTDPNTQLTYVLHSAAVSPGSSGSPVVNRKGEVIAVVIGNIPGSTNQAQSLNHAMWIGELDSQHAQQPADTAPIIVPPTVKPAPVNEKGEILGPNPDPEKKDDPSQDVPIKGVDDRPVTISPVAPTNATGEGTPTNTTGEGTPTNTTGECTPTDTTGECTPTDTTGEDTPTNATGEDTPTNATGEDTPTNATGEDTPTNATGEDTPTDTTGEDTPTDTTGEDTPTDTTGECTPTDTTGECTPTDTTGEDTPTDTTGEDTPTDTTGECTPTDTTGEDTPTDNGTGCKADGEPSIPDSKADDPTDESTTTPSDVTDDGPINTAKPEDILPPVTGTPVDGVPQPANGVIGTATVPRGPVSNTPMQPRPETLMSVSEDRPFSLTKVGQKTQDDGKVDIDLLFTPATGTIITKASVNEVPMDPKTRRVTITVEAKSQKVPVEVYVQGRRVPYSVDCTINPIKK